MIMNRYIWCLNPAILRIMSRWNKIQKDSEKQESGCFISVSYFICTDWISLGDLAERNLAACAELAYIISKMVLASPNTENTSNCLKHFFLKLRWSRPVQREGGRGEKWKNGLKILTLTEMRWDAIVSALVGQSSECKSSWAANQGKATSRDLRVISENHTLVEISATFK